MPFQKKGKDASGEKSSFGKKLKGVFSTKGESSATDRPGAVFPLPPQQRPPPSPATSPYIAGPQHVPQGLPPQQNYTAPGPVPSPQFKLPPPHPPQQQNHTALGQIPSPRFPLPLPSHLLAPSYVSPTTCPPPPPHLKPAVRQNIGPNPMYVWRDSDSSSRPFQGQQDYEEAGEDPLIRDQKGSPPPRRPYYSPRSGSPDGPQMVIVNLPEDPDADQSGEPRLVILVPADQAGLPSTGGPPLYVSAASESSDEFLAPQGTDGQPMKKTSRDSLRSRHYVDGEDFDGGAERKTNANDEDNRNLNLRYHFFPESMVPFWYIKDPIVVPKGSRNYLCGTCRHINITELFRQEESSEMPALRDCIVLETLTKLLGSKDCGLCKLASRIIAMDTGVKLSRGLSEEERLNKQKGEAE